MCRGGGSGGAVNNGQPGTTGGTGGASSAPGTRMSTNSTGPAQVSPLQHQQRGVGRQKPLRWRRRIWIDIR